MEADLSGRTVEISDDNLLHQIRNVLRFRIGTECVLLDGKGTKASAKLVELNKKFAQFEVLEREICEKTGGGGTNGKIVRLFCALPKKPATFELIVQKATELGVSQIVPLDTARCQVHSLYKTDRLKFIIKEAAEQCERIDLPVLCPLMPFKDFIARPPTGLILAGDPWDFDKPLREVVKETSKTAGAKEINLIIGPEGGLTTEEIVAIRKAGGTIFLLGKNVLRMETAAVAAISVVLFA